MRLYYAADAAAEIDRLLAEIAEQSPQGARQVAACILKAEQTLMEHPRIGQLTNTSQPAMRRFVLRPYPYLIFYQAGEGEIMIAGIRHGARNPRSMPGQS